MHTGSRSRIVGNALRSHSRSCPVARFHTAISIILKVLVKSKRLIRETYRCRSQIFVKNTPSSNFASQSELRDLIASLIGFSKCTITLFLNLFNAGRFIRSVSSVTTGLLGVPEGVDSLGTVKSRNFSFGR
jgi:hypothetical protein